MPISHVAILSREVGSSLKYAHRYHKVFVVSRKDDLTSTLQELKALNPQLRYLDIFTHAAEMEFYVTIPEYGMVPYLEGGYGLLLGSERIDHRNVISIFQPLAGCFVGKWPFVQLWACMAADTGPDVTEESGKSWTGDGVSLCLKLSSLTRAFVRASPSVQYFGHDDNGSNVWFQEWTPPVFVFTPSGTRYTETT